MIPPPANTTRPERRGPALLRAAAFAVLFALCAAGALGLQHARLGKIKLERPYQDSLFLPRKEVARILAFGYDMLAADFLFIRSIQAFGGQWNQAVKDYSAVFDYFDTIAELDPRFIDAYEFGSMVIGEEGKDPQRALELNSIGWLKNPDTYKPAYLNAYISWWTLRETKEKIPSLYWRELEPADATKFWATMAEKAPDCPEFVPRMKRYIDKETGRFAAAMERWIADYLQSIPRRDDYMLGICTTQFLDIVDKWNLDILYKALEQYRAANAGRLPPDLEALDAAQLLKDYSSCDFQKLVQRLETFRIAGIAPPGALESITREVFTTRSGVPPSPYGPNPAVDFYFLRRDIRPDQTQELEQLVRERNLIVNSRTAREFTEGALDFVRTQIRGFKMTHQRYPESIGELFPDQLNPWDWKTGTWNYDPRTGKVKSPTFPDL